MVRVVGLGVEGLVDDPGLVGHVEHRRDADVDERRPQAVVVGVGQRSPVDGRRGDHAETYARRRQRRQLRLQPLRVAEREMGHRMEPPATLGHHRRRTIGSMPSCWR